MSVEHRTEADEDVVRGAAGMPEPPAAVSVCEYRSPGWPPGSVAAVVMVSPPSTVIVKSRATEFDAASVTSIVTVLVPAAVGVPVIQPSADRFSPLGIPAPAAIRRAFARTAAWGGRDHT